MSNTDAILEQRGKTHGDFNVHAVTTQQIKQAISDGAVNSGVGTSKFSSVQQEALDMIAHKLGRIAAGDPNEMDHWEDIAGYATLVTRWNDNGRKAMAAPAAPPFDLKKIMTSEDQS